MVSHLQKIKINLKKNLVSVNFHVGQYAKIVEELKTENTGLKRKISSLVEENNDLMQKVRLTVPQVCAMDVLTF